ncbi:hypothetical protein [Lichenibacterium ramalinae]|uniref:Uncharacterized protein n=1 Tax=Lichenibacterium ramalinae TaxID=2316527 RepID=A0A4Q2R976_9HYPH|nr:hypothetical protein [Lichenibacterium ramalinae]RYB02030.1 hypothetical protein D3272_22960 [Lichenibacterium ramalinae]
MASKPLRKVSEGVRKRGSDALTLAPLDPLGPLPADGQAPPFFATLGGEPVAVLPLDEYRRLVQAALDGVAPRRTAPPKPALKANTRPVSTIERDAEVAAFLRDLFGQHKTVAELRAACIERFGEARTPSLTRITIFRQRTR